MDPSELLRSRTQLRYGTLSIHRCGFRSRQATAASRGPTRSVNSFIPARSTRMVDECLRVYYGWKPRRSPAELAAQARLL